VLPIAQTNLNKEYCMSFKSNMSCHITGGTSHWSHVNYRLKPTGQHSRREAFVNMIYLLLKQYITHHFSMVSSTSNLKDMELILIWIFLHGKVFTNEHQKLFRGRIPNKLHLSAAKCQMCIHQEFHPEGNLQTRGEREPLCDKTTSYVPSTTPNNCL